MKANYRAKKTIGGKGEKSKSLETRAATGKKKERGRRRGGGHSNAKKFLTKEKKKKRVRRIESGRNRGDLAIQNTKYHHGAKSVKKRRESRKGEKKIASGR